MLGYRADAFEQQVAPNKEEVARLKVVLQANDKELLKHVRGMVKELHSWDGIAFFRPFEADTWYQSR